ncbi:condensin complex subunit 2/barren [Suillus discolor]|uniref:Condensin complex subunit 2 n=1 Tax=Suillus discolor TaxID=1912936 RepID=A0A9P7JWU4_9AGAM|nr:condensin complex subunit 2/barren [Suillus discolor]KAG2113164.1 condensin complex subunit 2/barren [Suillus discolor]
MNTRRARIADTDHHDSDSGGDTEPDTPRPTLRQGSKKRISDMYGGESEAHSDTGRLPLRAVNVNDDAAEKRRRRKSNKLAVIENAEAGPSTERQDQAESSKAAQAKLKQQQLNSVAPPPVINVPLDVMSSNFEEWMKMATDNKINAANSWNFALIDYFHDMSLLRNNIDNSINFQRASCTLDGCVKIWTSRVDSVGTETGKLLSNLANEGMVGAEDDVALSDNPDSQDATQAKKKKKSHRPDSTLAKDASQLHSKKLELDLGIDPLFRKTCEDFDEGGAQGLLMNHLSLGVGSDGGMRVVFDASDSMGRVAEDEEDEEEREEHVDISYLRSQFFPDLDVLDDKAISHSLADFSFAKDSNHTFDDSLYRDDTVHNQAGDEDEDDPGFGDYGANDAPMDVDGDRDGQDFFQGDQAVDDDYDGGDAFGGGDYGGGDNGSVGAEGDQQHAVRPGGALVPFDPRHAPNKPDRVIAITDADGENAMMGYFDKNLMKNWAGPEHWKLRKVIRKPEADAPKPRREKKEAFKIDFLTPAEKDIKTIANEMFAKVTRGAGITLPSYGGSKTGKKGRGGRKAKEEKRDEHTLPDDMHFSSRQLVTLFLKPKFSLKMRGQPVRFNENGDGEVDEQFWAQAAANQAAERAAAENDETGDGLNIPFNTQFFDNDYDDGPGFDDGFDGDGAALQDAGEQDLLAATQGQTRRVRPEFVNYAKRAKRVDVRKLKENIWKGLDIKVGKPKEGEEDDDMDVDDISLTNPEEHRVFSSVISGLQKSYPKDKMEEISTSFCFICLLHLANEQGLKLQTSPGGQLDQEENEVIDSEDRDKVGDIWSLKVFRDPDATAAA